MSYPTIDKDESVKNPNEDSIVTDNTQGGKKVDANQDSESEQTAGNENLVTKESQKAKKVDGDPGCERDQPGGQG